MYHILDKTVHNCNIFHFNCRWYCKNVFVADIAIFVLKMLNSNQPKMCHHNTPFQHPQKGIHYSDLKCQIRYIHLKNSTFSAIMNKNHPRILHSNQWTCNQIGIKRQEMHSDRQPASQAATWLENIHRVSCSDSQVAASRAGRLTHSRECGQR